MGSGGDRLLAQFDESITNGAHEVCREGLQSSEVSGEQGQGLGCRPGRRVGTDSGCIKGREAEMASGEMETVETGGCKLEWGSTIQEEGTHALED